MLAVFTVAALALFLPSTPLSKSLPSFWADNVPKITLGLDLQGGMHLVLSVDQAKAVESHTHRLAGTVEDALKAKSIAYYSVTRTGASSVEVAYPDEKTKGEIKKVLDDEFGVFNEPVDQNGRLLFSLSDEEVKRIKDSAVSQGLETIRNRIDKFGVAEPIIQKQGEDEIVIQLPGLKDPARAIELIGKTAVLEFRLVDESMDPSTAASAGAPFGSEVLYHQTVNKETGQVEKTPYLVKKDSLLTGDSLADARVAFDSQYNEPYVSLIFDANGGRIFERVTRDNVGKRLAIVLDGNVHSAPQIREAISGGKAQISGGFAYEEATDLAIVLRAGALPAPVNIIQNVTVGPTLGADSIRDGVRAGVLGTVLVLVFMLIYYRLSGLVADIAIFLNIVMLLGAMAWLNATLTLPGIAGIVLTIGMGVDSNVLIFERIKRSSAPGAPRGRPSTPGTTTRGGL